MLGRLLSVCLYFAVFCASAHCFRIHLAGYKDYELNRFWASTGFCPGAVRDTNRVLSSDDVVQNLIHLSSLPRSGLEYVRIHWIFDLVTLRNGSYNFSQLDRLYDVHQRLNLYPHVEFMRSSPLKRGTTLLDWRDLVIQFLQHYIARYSLKEVNRWRFETWNEPDLPTYNLEKWKKPSDYLSYLNSLRAAFSEVRRRYPNFQGELRGPAGTFKAAAKHPFCYGALEQCQRNKTACPFDVLTFHRKGTSGRAKQILRGEIELLKELETAYPFLKTIMWANSEADPSTGWSLPLDSNTGIEYAREIVSNVFYHWTALNRGHSGRRLESISQDNAFLSYHPHEFSQRTLLARFQMNETQPPHAEFVQKPAFAALGFLANLGSRADVVRRKNGLTILKTTSRSESYYSVLLVGAKTAAKPQLTVNFTGFDTKKSFGALVEVLQSDQSDPYAVWQKGGAPAYPPPELLDRMRRGQAAKIFYVGPVGSYLKIQGSFRAPFLLQVRLCDKRTVDKWTFGNVSFHLVTQQSVIVHWRVQQKGFNCLRGFQVYFRRARQDKWAEVTQGYHVPWHSFHLQASNVTSGTVFGEYKVKAVEIFSGKSHRFSAVFRLRERAEDEGEEGGKVKEEERRKRVGAGTRARG